MSMLTFHNVSHRYHATEGVLYSVQDLSFTIEHTELVVLIGPSGSGKSTVIRMAAGLEQPYKGAITVGSKQEKNGIGRTSYMPQSDALLPWRTVIDNVTLGAEIQGTSRAVRRQKARELLPLFGLEGFERAYPTELSGGMRQRAAFLRTFLMERELVLLDEPLSALDALTRGELQDWLLRMWQHFSRTILLVTHDVQEAAYLADRVIVLTPRPGKIAHEIPITLPRPRSRHSPELIEQAAHLEKLIRENR